MIAPTIKVLFVCEGNMIRSQMAERFYNSLTKSNDAISAGAVATGLDHVGERAEEAMSEIGLSMKGQRSKQLTPEMVENTDKVIWFPTPYMPDYVKNSPKSEFWDVADPHYAVGRTLDTDRKARDEIKAKVEQLIQSST